MLRSLCKVARDFASFKNAYPKQNLVRCNSTYTNAFRRQTQQKEPVDGVKWVLLVGYHLIKFLKYCLSTLFLGRVYF